jgi:hypothetical protein
MCPCVRWRPDLVWKRSLAYALVHRYYRRYSQRRAIIIANLAFSVKLVRLISSCVTLFLKIAQQKSIQRLAMPYTLRQENANSKLDARKDTSHIHILLPLSSSPGLAVPLPFIDPYPLISLAFGMSVSLASSASSSMFSR